MTKKSISALAGLGGVSENDSELARSWSVRFDRLMILLAIVMMPFLVVIADETVGEQSERLLNVLEWAVLIVFTCEFVALLMLSNQRSSYLSNNWLNLLIIVVAALSLSGLMHGVWLAAARILRIMSILFLTVRGLLSTGRWFLARGIPLAIGFALVAWLLSGLGFFLLEPTIDSFGGGYGLLLCPCLRLDMVTWCRRLFPHGCLLSSWCLLGLGYFRWQLLQYQLISSARMISSITIEFTKILSICDLK